MPHIRFKNSMRCKRVIGGAMACAAILAPAVVRSAPAGGADQPGAGQPGSAPPGPPQAAPPLLMGTGVGMYTDTSTAGQVSSFTINPGMVSCGVGTLASGGDSSGPFAMLMYSTRIDDYRVEGDMISARGRMRSIAKVGGAVVEDIEHDFVAVASDTPAAGGFGAGMPAGADRFDVHFQTPFWDSYNPMCSPSTVAAGGCRFGGALLIGDVLVPR